LHPRPGASRDIHRCHARPRPGCVAGRGRRLHRVLRPGHDSPAAGPGRAPDGHRLRQRHDGDRRPLPGPKPGVLVPEELSVTGYDDSELSAHLSPPLTTVATGAVERGAIAMRALLAALASEVPEDVLADHTTVVRRGSIAAPPRATTRTVPTGVHRCTSRDAR